MNHFVLLLYMISGFGGLSSIIFLTGKYGRNTPYMKGYIKVHLIYTSMMLISLIILYLRVNVITGKYLMPLFISSILAGQGFLLYAIAHLSFIINSKGISSRELLFWKFFPSFYYVLAVLQFFLWFTPFTLVPILMGVPLFIGLSLWFSIRNHKAETESKKWKNWIWFAFMIFTISVIALEIILKAKWGFLGEYSINIPLIFLAWNGLSLYQFQRENTKGKVDDDSLGISNKKAIQWQLSEREKQIADAILRGSSNKEIASDLAISASTVKNHIYNIYRKTGVQSRVELVNILR